MAGLSKNNRVPMTNTTHLADWLGDLRALNRLFLDYLAALARNGRPCLNLPQRVARRLRVATAESLDRIADLPVALFRLELPAQPVATALPRDADEQARWSLAMTILGNAWHLARSHPFETRTFLHLSDDGLRRLRSIPVAEIATVARAPGLVCCAFANAALTWPALVRLEDDGPDGRMLTLIALQPPVSVFTHVPPPDPMRLSV
jgi:hypothetical protein